MKKPFILFFIPGMSPSEEARDEATALQGKGVQIGFRNLRHVDQAATRLETCDGVAGEVPANYAERFPKAEEVAEKFADEYAAYMDGLDKASGGVINTPDIDNPSTQRVEKTLADYGYSDGEYVYCEGVSPCSNHDAIWEANGQPYGPNNVRSYKFDAPGQRANMHHEDAQKEFAAGNVIILDKSDVRVDFIDYIKSEAGQAYAATEQGVKDLAHYEIDAQGNDIVKTPAPVNQAPAGFGSN